MECILCNDQAIEGLKYCPTHKARADKQTLAAKLFDQTVASLRSGDLITLDGDGETYAVQSIALAKNGTAFELEHLTVKNVTTKGTRVFSTGGYFPQLRKVTNVR